MLAHWIIHIPLSISLSVYVSHTPRYLLSILQQNLKILVFGTKWTFGFLAAQIAGCLLPLLLLLPSFRVFPTTFLTAAVHYGKSSMKAAGPENFSVSVKRAKMFLLQILFELNVCIWHLAVILCKCVNWPLAMNWQQLQQLQQRE